jgi:hypothetical protein
MEFPSLQTISFPSFVHDAAIIAGLGVALLAGLVFINLGVLLPGLLTALGGCHGDPRDRYVEFGPAAAPLISEPAPRRAASPETRPDQHPVVRPHLWRQVATGGAIQLAAPIDSGTR